ncbi:MAG: hypothetical protein ACR2NP_22885 [Pirellulaceae bacterium]
MWCSFCQQEVPGDLSADSRSICCTCCGSPENILLNETSELARPQLPRLGTIREQLANQPVTNDKSSTRCYVARIDELRQAARQQQGSVEATAATPPRMAGFFFTVFLFGQFMSNWGMLNDHNAAWLSGLVFSAFGFTIGLCSLLSQVNLQQQIIQRLMTTSTEKPALAPVQHKPHLAYSEPETQKVSA